MTAYSIANPACHVNDCKVDISITSSTDAGAHWTRGTKIAGPMHFKWAPATSSGYMFGDYFATTISSDGMAVPVLSVAAAPGVTLNQAIYSARFPIVGGTRPTTRTPSTNAVPRSVLPHIPPK
jgi:hypothetical protein